MLAFKRFVSIVVLVQLLLMLLFLLFPAVRTTLEGMDTGVEKERDFFQILTWISFGVLALQLVVENLDSTLLRRTVVQHEGKINELKAKLYDHQQRGVNPALGTTGTTALPPLAAPDSYPTNRPLA